MAIFENPKFKVFDTSGNLAVGYKITFSATGTSTPKPTYPTAADAAAATNANANPVITDSNGEAVCWPESGTYRINVTTDADVATTEFPIDGIVGAGTTLAAGEDLTLSSTSDILVNTNKFIVRGATGNTTIAGTLDVTGDVSIHTDLVLDNNKYINAKDTGGTERAMIGVSASDTLDIGVAALSGVRILDSTTIYLNDTSTETLRIEQDSTGDASLSFLLTGGEQYSVGIDNSDSDKFKISDNSALGTNDRIVITSSGFVGVSNSAPAVALDVTGAITSSGAIIGATVTATGALVGATLSSGNESFEYDEGTFTANYTGFSITAETAVYWTKVGKSVTITLLGFTGTGDSGTAVSINNIPSDIQPVTATVQGAFSALTDNSTISIGNWFITTGSPAVMNINPIGGWTASTSRVVGSQSFSYNI